MKTLDASYVFTADAQIPSTCRIRIFEDLESDPKYGRWPTTVVVTMLWEHPQRGAGIVNRIEEIATELRDLQRIRRRGRFGKELCDVNDMIFVQHIPPSPNDLLAEERFSRVTFKSDCKGVLGGPLWENITRREVTELIQCHLD